MLEFQANLGNSASPLYSFHASNGPEFRTTYHFPSSIRRLRAGRTLRIPSLSLRMCSPLMIKSDSHSSSLLARSPDKQPTRTEVQFSCAGTTGTTYSQTAPNAMQFGVVE